MLRAILSDVHSNLEALQAVLEDARGQGAEEIWCLGDTVGYGANPNECLDLLSSAGALLIAGNHDWAAVGKLGVEWFNPDAATAALWTGRQLREPSRRLLEGLPLREQRGAFALAHGSPREPLWEYLTSSWVARPSFDHFDTPYCLVGHTHLPAVFSYDPRLDRCLMRDFPPEEPLPLGEERLIINPGSVGQPRNGDPLASYALLAEDAGWLLRRRVPYDIEAAQRKIREAGLPPRLWQRLSHGW